MNRRDFLNWFGLFGLSASLPFAIAACTKSVKEDNSVSSQNYKDPSPAPTMGFSPRSDGFTPIGSLSALQAATSGVIAPAEAAVMVVNDASNPKKPLAVSPRCTHTACTVEWHKGLNEFVCPCHGARFSPAGEVKRGPAEKPLQTYAVKVEGDSILVKIV